MAAYTAVMIAIMLIQIICRLRDTEYELARKKQLKVCKDLGTYCGSKTDYRPVLDPQGKLLLLQLAPSTDLTNKSTAIGNGFWYPDKPECLGIKVADLDKVNWKPGQLG